MRLVEGAGEGSEEMASGGENRYRVLWEGAMLRCFFSHEKQFGAVANVIKFCMRQIAHSDNGKAPGSNHVPQGHQEHQEISKSKNKKELISMDNKGIIIYHEDYKALSDTLTEG